MPFMSHIMNTVDQNKTENITHATIVQRTNDRILMINIILYHYLIRLDKQDISSNECPNH